LIRVAGRAADVLAVTLPMVAVALASAAWATWNLSLALAGFASIGFVNRHVGDAAAARQAVASTAAARTAQRDHQAHR
jgi:creatinine amidohydrolase/Fe(II)-dependent formamide hydrolase-like protein